MTKYNIIDTRNRPTVMIRDLLRMLKRLVSDLDRLYTISYTIKDKPNVLKQMKEIIDAKKSIITFKSMIHDILDVNEEVSENNAIVREALYMVGPGSNVMVLNSWVLTYVCLHINSFITHAYSYNNEDYESIAYDIGVIISNWRHDTRVNIERFEGEHHHIKINVGIDSLKRKINN